VKNEVIIGDCADVLKELPDESIDCIVTDPPYGYSFMGLSWDKALPSEEALRECCRVLKPGAFGFFMCAPRQDVLSRMIIRLEDAGFNVNFSSIFWSFASGFPKSAAIDKLIDKRGTANAKYSELSKELCQYLKTSRELLGLSQKDIATYFPSKTGGLTGCVWNWENGANIPTMEQWVVLKDVLKLNNPRFIELIERAIRRREEAEREILSTRHKTNAYADGGGYLSGVGTFSKTDINYTAPATDKAREFSGAYTASLKPAVEVIICVMKPLSTKSYIDQVLDNGHGCLWLDECRIPYKSDETIPKAGTGFGASKNDYGDNSPAFKGGYELSPEGRFPANLLVSDNVLDRGIITKSTASIRKNKSGMGIHDSPTATFGKGDVYSGCNDQGDFSRYFSLDAWWSKKITELPEEQQKTFPFLITPKPSKSEKNKYIENKHPTVKPLKLMSYLITMGSREGDVILDPFAGSGTTLEACKLLNRVFIGIDSDPENEKYMRARGQLDEITLGTFEEAIQ